jgi:hypothetical protein
MGVYDIVCREGCIHYNREFLGENEEAIIVPVEVKLPHNKVKIFNTFNSSRSYLAREDLENEINAFAEDHEIINVSISAVPCGLHETYTAAVLYRG